MRGMRAMLRLAWVLGLGCTASSQRGEVVTLPGLALRIEVPAGTEVEARDGRAEFTFEPMTRRPRGMTIMEAERGESAVYDLRHGALRYRIESSDADNAGLQLRLIGRVEVAGRGYDVTCVEESEEAMTLGWCLHAVATLRAG